MSLQEHKILFLVTIASLFVASIVHAQTVVEKVAIESNKALYCVKLDDGAGQFHILGKKKGDYLYRQKPKRWKRKFKRSAKKNLRKSKRADKRGDFSSGAYFYEQYLKNKENVKEVKLCVQGVMPVSPIGIPPVPGPTLPLPTPTIPIPTPTIPLPPVADACQQFEGSSRDFAVRIINGSVCNNSTSVVRINMYTAGGTGQGTCSGSYVGDDSDTGGAVISFAAHCLKSDTGIVQVLAGGGTYTANTFYSHPDWGLPGQSTEEHDVALALLDQSLTIPSTPLCTSSSAISNGMRSYTAGYGLNDMLAYDGKLRAAAVDVDAVSSEAIRARYVAGTDVDGTTCNGDSGGPILGMQAGEHCVAGATSWGTNKDCGANGGVDDAYWSNYTSSSNQAFFADYTEGLVD